MATNKDFIVKNGLSVGEDISVSGSVTSHLQFDDSVQLQLGTDSDLKIYHDATDNYIDAPVSGHLYIQNQVAGKDIKLRADNGSGSLEDYLVIDSSTRKVKIKYGGNNVIETTSTGVNITGNAVLTGELRGPATFTIDPAAVGDNTGEVVIKGDLTVEGTTTTVNSTTLDVADKNITLNHGSGDTSATADGAGITIQDAVSSSTDATILWNATGDRFDFSHPVSVTGDIIGSSSLQIFRSAAGAASILLQRNGAAGPWSLAQGNTSTDYFEILEGANARMTIANGGATTFSGNLTSNGTITGADFSGITMGGSLSGSHDDAKVQYGTAFTGTPAQGHFFFDSLNQKLKVYTGSAFVDAVPAGGGGGGGSGSSDATATFRKYTYTLTGTTNAISGKEDDEVTTGDFISGRLYEITAVGDTDFTAIGASSNAIGVQFTATDVGGGTTGKAKEVLFYATGGTQNIEVYVNGVKAVEGSSNDYVATTGTSVTFTSNLVSGDVVDIQVYELLTQDSFYLKSETYTQAQIVAGFVAKSGDTMTGNLNVGAAGSTALFTAYGGAAARPTFVHASGYGGLQLAGTGAGSGPSLIFSNNWSNSVSEEYSIFLDGSNDSLVFVSGDPADVASEERMRLTSTGRLGIGTGSPGTELHVTSAGHNTYSSTVTKGTNHTGLSIVQEGGNTDMTGVFFGSGGSGAGSHWSAITGSRTNHSAHWGTQLNFYTHANNTSNLADATQKMIITGDGNVGIGTDSPFARSHIKDVGWSAGAPYGTVQLIEGNNVTDNNWGHLVITDTTTTNGNGGAISFATGVSTALNPFSGIKGVSEGASWGGIGFYSRPQSGTATQRVILDSDGHFKPSADATYDLGSSTLAWRNVYTNDLHLSNEGHEEGNSVDGTKGNWTIQEGEEHLYIINNKSGKKYKFALEEIE